MKPCTRASCGYQLKKVDSGARVEHVTTSSLSVTLNVWMVAAAACKPSLMEVPVEGSNVITGGCS
ncbi:hypothetical protein DPMN_022042 [Dreissena polymorpha]|uniref:Uncharacterized protein n=1 Tax=Dreissena polymorpha TaxID=45954 RepID=A0A9D4NN04_DREPO|nr:hypothetical protein DPMN_022042 [Dreissena polymorpha]